MVHLAKIIPMQEKEMMEKKGTPEEEAAKVERKQPARKACFASASGQRGLQLLGEAGLYQRVGTADIFLELSLAQGVGILQLHPV